jgi:hypothetical protein
MLNFRSSPSKEKNADLAKRNRRKKVEGNVEWVNTAVKDQPQSGAIVLLGGVSITDFRLRVAQSQVRQDLLPSFWSHIVLLNKADAGDWLTWEVSLTPAAGFGEPPKTNGVQFSRLSAYDDPAKYPNIACFHIPFQDLTEEKIAETVRTFSLQRSLVDMPGLIAEWLGFVWGVLDTPNPLPRGLGIPGAVFAEAVYGALGMDLTPGLSGQSSCPEAVWQSAKWWHDFYESGASSATGRPRGYYCLDQPAAAVLEEPSWKKK